MTLTSWKCGMRPPGYTCSKIMRDRCCCAPPTQCLQGCFYHQLRGLTIRQLDESWLPRPPLSSLHPSPRLQGGQREVLVLFTEAPVTTGKSLGGQHNTYLNVFEFVLEVVPIHFCPSPHRGYRGSLSYASCCPGKGSAVFRLRLLPTPN